MRELEATNGNEENGLKVKELSTQHKIILGCTRLDGTDSDLFVCLFPNSKYPERRAGQVFSSFHSLTKS